MSYKEKYNKLVEAIKVLQEANPSDEGIQNWVHDNVPELAESEDERIRKVLIGWFNSYKEEGTCGSETFNGIPTDNIIAWLEKQGEQKPDDNKPKFKVGDWIVDDDFGYVWEITEIQNKYYHLEGADGGSSLPTIEFVDEHFHHWKIEDANDGDVLYSIDSKQPFIYKERPQFSQARGYCCINAYGEFAIWNTIKCAICTDKYIPATKEQRDILFAKMKEAGYKWDSKQKELKKIPAASCIQIERQNEQKDECIDFF